MLEFLLNLLILIMCLFEGLSIEFFLLAHGQDLIFFSSQNLGQLSYSILRLSQCDHFLFIFKPAGHHQEVLETNLCTGNLFALFHKEHLLGAH